MAAFAENKPKIYLFVSQRIDGWLLGIALAEDGVVLGGRLACGREWFRFHLGLTSTLMHQRYRDHFSGGYLLVEVPDDEISVHPGLVEALRRNQELDAAASA